MDNMPSILTGIADPNQYPVRSGETRSVNRPVADVWRADSRNSERVSQLLMGSRVRVLKCSEDWAWIESEDTYRGWMETRFLALAEPTPWRVESVFADIVFPGSAFSVRFPMGSRFTSDDDLSGGADSLVAGDVLRGLRADGLFGRVPSSFSGSPSEAARLALRFLGTPYLWGGGSAFGFDCSGLVQFCYAMQGILLRRDADIQRSDDRFCPVLSEERHPGDLVFFGGDGRITHVGLDLGNGFFVHSAGGTGVIVTQWGDDRFSPAFVDARRLVPDRAATPPTRYEAEDR